MVNIFYVSLTIISRCVADESNTGNCIFDQYTWVRRTFGTGKSQPSNLTSGTFYAFAHQRLFPCTFPLIRWAYLCDSPKKFHRGRRRFTPHGITQPHFVRWHGNYTIHNPCNICYWNIMSTFFKWPLSVPFELHMAMLGRRQLQLPIPNSSGTFVTEAVLWPLRSAGNQFTRYVYRTNKKYVTKS